MNGHMNLLCFLCEFEQDFAIGMLIALEGDFNRSQKSR